MVTYWFVIINARAQKGLEAKFRQYSNLAWDDLITLLVWVNKENSMKFLLDSLNYLYTILALTLASILYIPL